MSTIQLDISDATLAQFRRLADEAKVPLNRVLADAIDRIAEGQRQMADMRARAERGRHVDIRAILAKAPDVPPMAGDEIE